MGRTKAYKVVSELPSGELVSVDAGHDARCKYGVGVITKAPSYLAKGGYKLLVFSTKKEALDFCMGVANRHVYLAWGTGVRYRLPARLHSCVYERRNRISFSNPLWELKWPSGTIMCDSIELVERVDDQESIS